MSETLEIRLCQARPSRRSTARCELEAGHTEAVDYFLSSFHAGHTESGHWKFWRAEEAAGSED